MRNSEYILQQRYVRRDADGNATEHDGEDVFMRVAEFLGETEEEIEAFFQMMNNKDALPNSPTLANAGIEDGGCLSACFVVSPDDDTESIFNTLKQAAHIVKSGGGVGFGFSKLRPYGDAIKTVHKKALGPINVMEIYSIALNKLTQGGSFREAALMGQLHISHPDILEFIHCKDDRESLSNFNISVMIPNSFMRAVGDNDEWDLINPRNGEVVDTVSALWLWNEIITSAHVSGDPGVMFYDAVQDSHPNNNLGLINSTNPCVVGDTLVYTVDGMIPIKDLVGKNPELILYNGEHGVATKVWSNGFKDVYRLNTKEGYNVTLTPEHKIMTKYRGMIPANELIKGEELVLLNTEGGFGKDGSIDHGRVLGWLTGDGTIGDNNAVLYFYGEDKKAASEIMSESVQNIVKTSHGARKGKNHSLVMESKKGSEYIISANLKKMCNDIGLYRKNSRHIPNFIFTSEKQSQIAYLQSLFSADGSVGINSTSTDIRLASIYRDLLVDVQKLLINLGIASKIYLRRDGQYKLLPKNNGTNDKSEYFSKILYELFISKSSILKYQELIGFLHVTKNNRLQYGIDKYVNGPKQENFRVSFDSLEYVGIEEVFDLTEPSSHSFIANGLLISNCGEQALEDFGSCNLASINLSNFINEEGTHWDYERLTNTINTLVVMLNRVIDKNTFPLQALDDMNQLTRRIGLGVMGWADALVKLGIKYDSEDGVDEAHKISNFISRVAWAESERLATIDGPFPNYKDSKKFKMSLPPTRNSCVMSIAPTGTISRIAECSFGIEPFFDVAWKSNILWHEGVSTQMYDCPKYIRDRAEQFFNNDETKINSFLAEVIRDKSTLNSINISNEEIDDLFRTSYNISYEWHVQMQAAWQENVSNSISKTINMNQDATVEDVSEAYFLAWELGCKGITIYRSGTRAVEVLTNDVVNDIIEDNNNEEEEWEEKYNRPSIMSGFTKKVPTGHGSFYVTMNYDDLGRIREVITNMGKAGACDNASLEVASRMISLALQYNIPVSEIIEQLRGITCCPYWHEGSLIRSPYDGLAQALDNHEPIRILEDIKSEHYEEEEVSDAKDCWRCGQRSVVDVSGCPVCLHCGYSKCG